MTCRINPAPEALRPLAPLPESLSWLEGSLQRLQSEGLMRPHRVRRGRQGRLVELDGRELVNFGANDYLGYAGDVRLTRSCSKGSCAEGFGSGASPLVSGHSQAHEALESALANLLQTEAAIVFPSGFAANAATIPALVGEGDLIVSDERNHASIIDGCRLTRARLLVYPHRDLRTLVSQVEAALPARRLLIVTDSLFSMDGTVAPLADLCDIADRFGGMLMVDEAHATGVFGDRGSGLLEATGCTARVSIRVGTLSKALGTAGGFVAGPQPLIHWLRHAARAWIFSTAHPPGVAAAATTAITLLEQEPFRRRELLEKARQFRAELTALKALPIASGQPKSTPEVSSHIVPVVVGTPEKAVTLSHRLAEAGFFVPAIRPPSVPRDGSLVRVSLSWHHTDDDLSRLASAISAELS